MSDDRTNSEEAARVTGTPEAREQAERSVMYPETATRKRTFLSHEIELRALPIFHARKLNVKLEGFKKDFLATVEAAEKGGANPLATDMDESSTKALLDVARALAAFYGVPYRKADAYDDGETADQIERDCSVEQLIDLAHAQMEVNGKSDFLLTPLRIIMRLNSLVGEAIGLVEQTQITEKDIQSLAAERPPSSLPTSPSAKAGGST